MSCSAAIRLVRTQMRRRSKRPMSRICARFRPDGLCADPGGQKLAEAKGNVNKAVHLLNDSGAAIVNYHEEDDSFTGTFEYDVPARQERLQGGGTRAGGHFNARNGTVYEAARSTQESRPSDHSTMRPSRMARAA